MKSINKLRVRLSRRRSEKAQKAFEQERGRRALEADDKSMVEAAHPPGPPSGWGGVGGF